MSPCCSACWDAATCSCKASACIAMLRAAGMLRRQCRQAAAAGCQPCDWGRAVCSRPATAAAGRQHHTPACVGRLHHSSQLQRLGRIRPHSRHQTRLMASSGAEDEYREVSVQEAAEMLQAGSTYVDVRYLLCCQALACTYFGSGLSGKAPGPKRSLTRGGLLEPCTYPSTTRVLKVCVLPVLAQQAC